LRSYSKATSKRLRTGFLSILKRLLSDWADFELMAQRFRTNGVTIENRLLNDCLEIVQQLRIDRVLIANTNRLRSDGEATPKRLRTDF
jgi:hypothetical protein